MKFTNLLAEMARGGINQRQLAERISMRPETLSKKIVGKSEFTLGECKKIRDILNPDLKLEYLFEEVAV